MPVKYISMIFILFVIFESCENPNKIASISVEKSNITSIDTASWLKLFDTIIDNKRYGLISPNDTINNTIFFYADNEIFQLNSKKLEFDKGISDFYMEVSVYYKSSKIIRYEKIIIRPNYYFFVLSNSRGMFQYICILFRGEKGIKKCLIFPNHLSKLVNFGNSSINMLWCSYFDSENEIFATEERIADYNSGPYLVSVYKINKDTISCIGESINNHENFKQFKKEQAPFDWMLIDQASAGEAPMG